MLLSAIYDPGGILPGWLWQLMQCFWAMQWWLWRIDLLLHSSFRKSAKTFLGPVHAQLLALG